MPLNKRPQHLPPSPIKVDSSPMSTQQGIVAILSSDISNKAPSIRRTLSADMSSKKWLEQNGLLLLSPPPLKKEQMAFPSSPDSSLSFPSEGEEELEKRPGQDDVWRLIQLEKQRNHVEKPKSDAWGSLITQKSENLGCNALPLPPPYVHPKVKRSSSVLSEKSLQICTESLGSETGSDGSFPSYSPSEISIDSDEEKEIVFKEANLFEDMHVPKYKVSPARPFPPPISSIGGGDGAGGLHMHSHRENGRLVLEAVNVPPRNYFQAQRSEGRLVLTLVSCTFPHESEHVEENEVEEEFEGVFDKMEEFDGKTVDEEVDDDGYEDEEEAEEEKIEEKQVEFLMEQNIRSLPSKMISVHKSGLMVKKLMNQNPTWSNKVEVEELTIPQSLPPLQKVTRLMSQPPPPATASFNAYEYFWRNKNPVLATRFTNNNNVDNNNNNKNNNGAKAYEHQDLAVRRENKSENFIPYFRGCKEGRRSLLIWEPYCIATS